MLVSMASVICFSYLKKEYNISISCYRFVSDSNAIMAIITAVCGFMCFKNLKKPQSFIINKTASSIFGVLLIHANSNTMRQWLWKDTLNVTGQYMNDFAIINAIV